MDLPCANGSPWEIMATAGKRLGRPICVRDGATDAMEIEEDIVLTRFAEERERSFDRQKALTHSQVWAHLSRSGR